MKLAGKNIDTVQLQPGQKEIIRYDSEIPGFGLRVRQGGSRTFIFQYRLGKLNRRLTLGTAVKEAFPGIRQRVLELQAQVRLGQDPAGEKKAAIEAVQASASASFKSIAELYLAQQIKRVRPRTYRNEQHFLMDRAKALHAIPLATITRREIAVLLNETEARVVRGMGAATANKMRAYLSMLFNWAMREGLCENNPVVATNRRDQKSRSRVLPMDELVAIWHALPTDNFGSVIKLLMLTAQRRQEIGGLQWRELDEGFTRITLPPLRQKNNGGKDQLDHIVPLSEPARDILTRQMRVKGWNCLFSDSDNGMGNWGNWKNQLNEKLPDLAHWTLHDLRRSVATHMAEQLGVLPHVIEAILNHQSGSKAGVAGVYNRARYLKEATEALDRWARHLMAHVNDMVVVPMKKLG